MDNMSDERKAPKRASRKRATRTADSSSLRRRASRKIKDTTEEKRAVSAPSPRPAAPPEQKRKAPTPFASKRALVSHRRKQQFIVLALIGIGIGASAAVGVIDKGQIDVQQTIEDRNERIKNNQAKDTDVLMSDVVVPVQNTNTTQKADGGLRGLGTGGTKPAPAPVPDTASSTASSSDEMASSTDMVASSTESTPDTEETADNPEEG